MNSSTEAGASRPTSSQCRSIRRDTPVTCAICQILSMSTKLSDITPVTQNEPSDAYDLLRRDLSGALGRVTRHQAKLGIPTGW